MLPPRDELERLYAYPSATRPWIRSNFVATVDGAATAADGVSGSMGGEADKSVFDVLRSLADVIVVGAGTARAEGYGPTEPDAATLAVVSRHLDIPAALVGHGVVVITSEDAPADALADLRRTNDVIACGTGDIDWSAVLAELSSRGWDRVLCEGGPSLHGDLVELDLVDEVCLTVAPVMSAGGAPRIAGSGTSVDRAMTLAHTIEAGDVLLTRWVRDR